MRALTVHRGKNWCLMWKPKLRDFFIGVRWGSLYNLGYEARNGIEERVRLDIYVVIIPCLPFHFSWHPDWSCPPKPRPVERNVMRRY